MLIEGATLVSFDPPAVTRGDVLVENGIISKTGRRLRPRGDVHRVDAHGRVVIPGLVSAHTNIALDPFPGLAAASDRDQDHIGRLRSRAAAHDEASVICATFGGALRALQAGTTCIVDSHASPAFVEGSTQRLREVLLTIGLRALVGYRVSADDGADALSAAVTATRQAAIYGGSEQLRFSVNAGNLLEVSDDDLAELAAIAKETESPFAAEIGTVESEAAESKKRFKASPVDRLERAGLLGAQTVLRVGPFIDEGDAQRLSESGAVQVGCPAADLAAGRPLVSPSAWLPGGALGTDELTADVLGQARLAWHRLRADDPVEASQRVLELVAGGHRLAERLFGVPFGRVAEGCAGDLVILDYRPTWPLNDETVAQHLVGGFDTARVLTVMVNGRFLIRDGAVATLDTEELLRQLQRGALDYWQALSGETYPGWTPAAEEEEPEPADEPEVVDDDDEGEPEEESVEEEEPEVVDDDDEDDEFEGPDDIDYVDEVSDEETERADEEGDDEEEEGEEDDDEGDDAEGDAEGDDEEDEEEDDDGEEDDDEDDDKGGFGAGVF